MKLLFFVDRLLRGGIQTFVLNLTLEFKKLYPHVEIDYLNFDDGVDYELEEFMRKQGCNVYKVCMPSIRTIKKTIKELDDFFNKHHDYDIIHAHASSKGFLPLYYASKYGIKIRIAHSHSTNFCSNNPLYILAGNLLKGPLCRVATDYFACSELAGKWLFGNVFRKNIEIKILKNGIFLDNFVYDPIVRENMRKEFACSSSMKIIGHVGRFSSVKNHKFLIDIFKSYHTINPQSLLMLLGTGDLLEEMKCYVKTLGLDKSVMFLGFRNDTHKFYQVFDIFVMPSFYEGLPFVGIEAQAAGLPCAFSENIAKEIKILESTHFISLDKSSLEWAEIIQSMLEHTERKDVCQELTSAGYDVRLEARKLYNYYKNSIDCVRKK